MNPLQYIRRYPYLALLVGAIALRVLLGFYTPTPHGYVYDFYSDAIKPLTDLGRLPRAEDCFICYHPPLLPIIGGVIFKAVAALGGSYNVQHYFLASFTGVLSLVFCVYAYGLYRRYIDSPINLAIWGLVLYLPVLFIASFSIEADLMVSTFIVIAIYYFDIYRDDGNLKALIIAAVMAGLAALTKYSGLVICVVLGLFLLYDFIQARTRDTFVRGLVFAVICTIAGGYPYITNLARYGTPFMGNDAWKTTQYHTEIYNFTEFDLREAITVMKPNKTEAGMLSEFPIYNSSVLTTHYVQLWTDFSFFSNPTRHGHMFGRLVYQLKSIPIEVIRTVLYAGLIPLILSLAGFVSMLVRHRKPLLFAVLFVSLAVYIEWFLGFHIWMLKTKYLLYLLPVWFIMIGYGARLINERIAAGLLVPSVIASAIYCYCFAVM